MNSNYGGVIWTNHALQRLTERGIKQSDAYNTFCRPQESRPAQTKGAYVFYRTYGKDKLEVVASKNDRGQWVIMSVWSRPAWEKTRQTKDHFLENVVEKVLKKTLGRFKKNN